MVYFFFLFFLWSPGYRISLYYIFYTYYSSVMYLYKITDTPTNFLRPCTRRYNKNTWLRAIYATEKTARAQLNVKSFLEYIHFFFKSFIIVSYCYYFFFFKLLIIVFYDHYKGITVSCMHNYTAIYFIVLIYFYFLVHTYYSLDHFIKFMRYNKSILLVSSLIF